MSVALSSSFSETYHRVSPTLLTSEDLSSRSELALSSRPVRAEPTTAEHAASATGSDPQVSARSVTPTPISFDALNGDPIPLKGCVLLNRHAFMVRNMASPKDKRRGLVWSREE